MRAEAAHAAAIALQSHPELAQPDAPIMATLRKLYDGQPMTEDEFDQIEQMIATA
jgi:hypothetical protein